MVLCNERQEGVPVSCFEIALLRGSFEQQDSRETSFTKACFKILDELFKYFFTRVNCSEKSQSLAFDKDFFDSWCVAQGEVSVLKCFSRIEV